MGLFGRWKKDTNTARDAAAPQVSGEPESSTTVTIPPGPHDISAELVADVTRVSLGSLYLPVVQGMQLTTPKPIEGRIPLVEVGLADTVMQLALLATSRSGGLWDQLVPQLSAELEASGYRTQQVATASGTGLLAKPADPGEGRMDLLLEGFQGKGWLLRAIFRGAAATDMDKQAPLRKLIEHAIVDRGEGFYAPGDIIALHEPQAPAEGSAQLQPGAAGEAAPAEEPPGHSQAPGAQV